MTEPLCLHCCDIDGLAVGMTSSF